MGFVSESNLIIFLIFALLVLLICHKLNKFSNHHKQHNICRETFRDAPDRRSSRRKSYNIYPNNDMNEPDTTKTSDKNVNINIVSDNMNGPVLKKSNKKKYKIPIKKSKKVNSKQSRYHVMNNEFTEIQYHKDYNDTLTAINNLTTQKEMFNLGFLPAIESTPDAQNVKSLVKLFLQKLNFEVETNVEEYLHTNSGWNDMGKRKREKSGFEEQMEDLGLPGTLYNESAKNARVMLVKVDKAEQFTTDDQIRFIVYMIVQKENVNDQMVLQVHFFMERDDLIGNRDDRADFFNKGLKKNGDDTKINDEQLVIIEQVFILGFLTNSACDKTKMDKFHDYNDIHNADGTIDQEKVVKTMLKKHKERETELNSFIITQSNETDMGYDNNDMIRDARNKNKRSIMDNLSKFPE